MYTGLLHSHRLIVILFLVHYIIKLVLLLLNRQDSLSKYSQKMRVPEIILSVGFLLTGGMMLLKGAAFTHLIIIKLVCVFASIPLAVIGFKKGNKVLAFLAVFLIIMSYGLAEMNKKAKTGKKIDTSSITDPVEAGKLIYNNKCAQCHGTGGSDGKSGAKDLTLTTLTEQEQKTIIRNGKNAMPGYKEDVLSEQDIDAVIQFLKTIKIAQ